MAEEKWAVCIEKPTTICRLRQGLFMCRLVTNEFSRQKVQYSINKASSMIPLLRSCHMLKQNAVAFTLWVILRLKLLSDVPKFSILVS